jgi:KDO2-lipid IV(A) lauroyltransferase
MSRQRSVVTDYLVYVAVRVVVAVVQALPYRAACALAKVLAWLAYHVDRRHRLVAMENIRHAYPGRYSYAQADQLVRATYLHFCRLLVEITHLPRVLRVDTYQNFIEMDKRLWCDLMTSGRPLLLVTAHFGNWEVGGFLPASFGFRTYAIARTLDNRFLHKWFLEGFREKSGQVILSKNDDFDRIQGVLEGNGVIATLGDQDAGAKGLFVDFFGRPASTHKAVALLSMQFKAPMVVLGIRRDGPGEKRQPTQAQSCTMARHHLMIEDVIYPEEYEGKPGAVREMTQRFTNAIERFVNTAPEQYFWLHRRWKHQPRAKGGRRAA